MNKQNFFKDFSTLEDYLGGSILSFYNIIPSVLLDKANNKFKYYRFINGNTQNKLILALTSTNYITKAKKRSLVCRILNFSKRNLHTQFLNMLDNMNKYNVPFHIIIYVFKRKHAKELGLINANLTIMKKYYDSSYTNRTLFILSVSEDYLFSEQSNLLYHYICLNTTFSISLWFEQYTWSDLKLSFYHEGYLISGGSKKRKHILSPSAFILTKILLILNNFNIFSIIKSYHHSNKVITSANLLDITSKPELDKFKNELISENKYSTSRKLRLWPVKGDINALQDLFKDKIIEREAIKSNNKFYLKK